MSTKMHYGAAWETFQIAERLRKQMTVAEKHLWKRVCKNQLGVRIRRQHPIWKFVADFYCHDVKLVIEIDGKIHLTAEAKQYDISRAVILDEFKIEILRFTNDQVLNKTDLVIRKIKSTIQTLKEKIRANVNDAATVPSSINMKSP